MIIGGINRLLRLKLTLRITRHRWVASLLIVVFICVPLVTAQQRGGGRRGAPIDVPQKDNGKLPTDKELEKKKEEAKAGQIKLSPVEVIAEPPICEYGG